MLTIIWPWIWLLFPLPLLFKRIKQKQQGGHLKLPATGKLTGVQQQKASTKKYGYWLLWLLFLTAICRPQWFGDPIDLPSKGRDLMVAVDLSGSMQIEDMVLNNQTVDRFTMIRHVVSDFIQRRKGDRIGLILFADHAYLQAPLTLDRRSVSQFLKEAQIGLVGKQTAIGEAIGLAVKRFDKVKESNRILILLTDGSNNAGVLDPQQAADIAAKQGITIYTIGVGADILEQRTLFGRQRVNPSMDLDINALKAISNKTHGKFFRARNTEELEKIYHEIDKLEPIARDQQTYRPRSELFYYPLALMLLLHVFMCLSRLPTLQNLTKIKSGEQK
ncbi:VWA domain-containing protein [Parashewanella curva]|uniref:VWA domain-containing protein n=1 Tax=Parashewanella curva TaxID=2338552 RepID=A0A3L8PY56_9GAMM|nr:VWA domain-containing protein [Parashewanella curva]RLV60356.1 VWA domain-containing protein [Parashewanella curva]